jgi:hypothetical protein
MCIHIYVCVCVCIVLGGGKGTLGGKKKSKKTKLYYCMLYLSIT